MRLSISNMRCLVAFPSEGGNHSLSQKLCSFQDKPGPMKTRHPAILSVIHCNQTPVLLLKYLNVSH